MISAPQMPDISTFSHFNGTSETQIDYVITCREQPNPVKKISVDNRSATNLRAHDAVIAVLEATITLRNTPSSVPHLNGWINRCGLNDYDVYKQKVEHQLQSMLSEMEGAYKSRHYNTVINFNLSGETTTQVQG